MYAGATVGPYRIVRQLGAGGMGVVWLADDPRLDRKVALKTVRQVESDTAESRQRLLREARAAAALNHANIATVHDVLDVDGEVIVVFEYVEGETLATRLQRAPMTVPEAVEVAWQLADALAAAHAQGIIHRDLKPTNVVLGADGRAKVLDFGIARLVPAGADMSASAPGTIGIGLVGTPGYAAPEQYVSRNVDGRADLYALGVMLFEMVSGHRPFPGGDQVALATSVLASPAPKLTATGLWVPPALETLVAQLLERDPAQRPRSADEVLVALSPLRDTESSPLARRTLLVRRGIPRTTLAAAGLAIAVATAVVVRVVWPGAPRGPAMPVVAVLPLQNMSGDATNDYLGPGLAETLITSLAAVPSVTVLSRGAVDETRQLHPDRASFLDALDASYLVEGTVQAVADRLRVTLNLVRHDESVAWGTTIEGPARDLFSLQGQLAAALTDAIADQAPSDERPRPASLPTASEAAQIAYWKGRSALDRRDLAGNTQAAVQAFEDAVQADPRFAMAHAGLAEARWAMYVATNDPSWAQGAVDATTAALSLEPDRPSVRYTAALTMFRSGKYAEAQQEAERAIELQPTYEDAIRLLGRVLMRQGQVEAGRVQYARALEIRPNSVSLLSDMGLALYNAGHYAEALEVFDRAIALSPNSSLTLSQAGAASQAMGDDQRALDYYARATAIQPRPETFSSMGTIYYGQGEFAKAAGAYEAAILIRPLGATTHRNLGDAYTHLGRRDDARKAYQQAATLADAEVQVSPSDARAIARLAVYQEKAGDDEAARRSVDRARALAPNDGEVFLRTAVVHALAGRTAGALAALEGAVGAGISRRRVAAEEDFDSLRSEPRFRALTANPAEEKR